MTSQASEKSTYTLQIGKKGQERLEILNELHNPNSLQFLLSNGLKQGDSVLDLACGIGTLTCEISKIVRSEGKVLGVDVSEEQIAIAEDKAKDLENTSFKTLSANDLEKLDQKFDLIYCRFLLIHLKNPEDVINKALSLLKPKGRIILEELMTLGGLVSYPHSKGHEGWANAIKFQGGIFDTDFEIGKKLPHILTTMNYKIQDARAVTTVLKNEREKSILRLGAEECREGFTGAGFMTNEEVDQLIKDLEAFENDNSSFATYGLVMQVCGAKVGE